MTGISSVGGFKKEHLTLHLKLLSCLFGKTKESLFPSSLNNIFSFFIYPLFILFPIFLIKYNFRIIKIFISYNSPNFLQLLYKSCLLLIPVIEKLNIKKENAMPEIIPIQHFLLLKFVYYLCISLCITRVLPVYYVVRFTRFSLDAHTEQSLKIRCFLELSVLSCFLNAYSNSNCHTNHWVVTCSDQSHHFYVCRNR